MWALPISLMFCWPRAEAWVSRSRRTFRTPSGLRNRLAWTSRYSAATCAKVTAGPARLEQLDARPNFFAPLGNAAAKALAFRFFATPGFIVVRNICCRSRPTVISLTPSILAACDLNRWRRRGCRDCGPNVVARVNVGGWDTAAVPDGALGERNCEKTNACGYVGRAANGLSSVGRLSQR
jgi:hypothetical protein